MTINPPIENTGKSWELLNEMYQTNRARDLADQVHELEFGGVPKETGSLLYGLIRQFHPRQTIETGFAFGFSTLFILQALADNGSGRHLAIDPVESTRWHGIGLANVRRSGHAAIFQHIETISQFALPGLLQNQFQTDFAFIDGSHLFDEALLDAYYVDRLLVPGGIMVIDDWHHMPAVRSAVNFVEANYTYEVLSFPVATNVRVLRKLPGPAREWNHFVPFVVLTEAQLRAEPRPIVLPFTPMGGVNLA
jgi:predicted O-methyltransferase YrrM